MLIVNIFHKKIQIILRNYVVIKQYSHCINNYKYYAYRKTKFIFQI